MGRFGTSPNRTGSHRLGKPWVLLAGVCARPLARARTKRFFFILFFFLQKYIFVLEIYRNIPRQQGGKGISEKKFAEKIARRSVGAGRRQRGGQPQATQQRGGRPFHKDDEDDDTSNAAASHDEPCTIPYCNCPCHKKKDPARPSHCLHHLQWLDTAEKAQRSLLRGGTATRTT